MGKAEAAGAPEPSGAPSVVLVLSEGGSPPAPLEALAAAGALTLRPVDTLATLPDGSDPVLLFARAPAAAVAQALAGGAGPQAALTGWRDATEALLAACRPLRQRLMLVDPDAARAAPGALVAALAGRLGHPLDPPVAPGPDAGARPEDDGPLLELLAAACLAADPAARRLADEMSAMMLPLADPESSGPASPDPASPDPASPDPASPGPASPDPDARGAAALADRALTRLRALTAQGADRALLQGQIDAMQADLARIEATEAQATAQAAAAFSEAADLRAQLTALQADRARQEAAAQEARDRQRSLEAELVEAQRARVTLEVDAAALRDRLAAAEAGLAQIRQQAEDRTGVQAALEEERSGLQAALDEARARLQATLDEAHTGRQAVPDEARAGRQAVPAEATASAAATEAARRWRDGVLGAQILSLGAEADGLRTELSALRATPQEAPADPIAAGPDTADPRAADQAATAGTGASPPTPQRAATGKAGAEQAVANQRTDDTARTPDPDPARPPASGSRTAVTKTAMSKTSGSKISGSKTSGSKAPKPGTTPKKPASAPRSRAAAPRPRDSRAAPGTGGADTDG